MNVAFQIEKGYPILTELYINQRPFGSARHFQNMVITREGEKIIIEAIEILWEIAIKDVDIPSVVQKAHPDYVVDNCIKRGWYKLKETKQVRIEIYGNLMFEKLVK